MFHTLTDYWWVNNHSMMYIPITSSGPSSYCLNLSFTLYNQGLHKHFPYRMLVSFCVQHYVLTRNSFSQPSAFIATQLSE